ncbi:hypothetical protein [Pararhodobacter sp.]|uniref:hypothetical protein n=1 Tax=Pararhodobacter sp. TaxID=2127056 RepID=UPI002FDF5FD9
MSDPISALISAGGRLLGGLFNRTPSAFKQSRQGILGQAAGAREAAELYGFNPLTLLGVSSPLGAGSGPGMGNAIGEAMALLADGFSRRSDVGQKEALERENTTLKERLTRATLQPQVPGIYDRIEQGPMIGGSNARVSQGAGVGVAPVVPAGQPVGAGGNRSSEQRPLGSGIDPRRETEHVPNSTTSGFMTVDSPYLPFQVHYPTIDGDEPIQWYDYPTLVPPLLWAGSRYMYQRARREERDERERQVPPSRRRAFGFTPNAFFPH